MWQIFYYCRMVSHNLFSHCFGYVLDMGWLPMQWIPGGDYKNKFRHSMLFTLWIHSVLSHKSILANFDFWSDWSSCYSDKCDDARGDLILTSQCWVSRACLPLSICIIQIKTGHISMSRGPFLLCSATHYRKSGWLIVLFMYYSIYIDTSSLNGIALNFPSCECIDPNATFFRSSCLPTLLRPVSPSMM